MAQVKPALEGNTWYEKQANKFEASRFGSMCWMLIAQAAWGGLAVGLALWADPIELWAVAGVAILSGGTNAMMIAMASGKACIGFFYSSIIFSTIVILWQLILMAL